MTEFDWQADGDPTHRPFWEAATRRTLLIQQCADCDQYQFYARPFCIRCESDAILWSTACGTATVYSVTTVRKQWVPGFTPPYSVAIVELDEGPRLLTNIINGDASIGDRVRVVWRERTGLPPVPVFEPLKSELGEA